MVKLTIECEPHELRQALRELLDGDSGLEIGEGAPKDPTTGGSWSSEDVETLYLDVQKDARRMLLALFNAYPNGLTWEEWQQSVGLHGIKFGGARSSIGHQHNRFPGRPDPVIWQNDKYFLQPTFATALRAVLPNGNPAAAEVRDRAARADQDGKLRDAFLGALAERVEVDPDDYEEWADVADQVIKGLDLN